VKKRGGPREREDNTKEWDTSGNSSWEGRAWGRCTGRETLQVQPRRKVLMGGTIVWQFGGGRGDGKLIIARPESFGIGGNIATKNFYSEKKPRDE